MKKMTLEDLHIRVLKKALKIEEKKPSKKKKSKKEEAPVEILSLDELNK